MNNDVFITCAVTGSGPSEKVHPNLPVTPAQIAKAAIDAARAGAAIVHIHARDPETGNGLGPKAHDPALFREIVDRIRASGTDVVINLTTGIGGDFVPGRKDPNVADKSSYFVPPERRMQHVMDCLPEICSLDVATMNFGDDPILNLPRHLRIMAEMALARGVKPELEVFDLGHIRLASQLIEAGLVPTPALFQFCLGVRWGAPANAETILHMRSMLPPGSDWSAFAIGAGQMPMVAQSCLLGGHVRVGLEDNLYLSKGVFASNAQLVEKAAGILMSLGANLLTPQQTREKLGLKKSSA